MERCSRAACSPASVSPEAAFCASSIFGETLWSSSLQTRSRICCAEVLQQRLNLLRALGDGLVGAAHGFLMLRRGDVLQIAARLLDRGLRRLLELRLCCLPFLRAFLFEARAERFDGRLRAGYGFIERRANARLALGEIPLGLREASRLATVSSSLWL